MANTVSVLSYANTFGDWVVATNALAREHNDLVANNLTKSTGTLYLTDPSLGIQVSGAAIVAGALQVQGTGSSAYVQNNIRIDGTLAATNSTNSIYSTGVVTSLGRVNANSTGLGLFVANNFTVGGTANASNLFVTSTTTTGNLVVSGTSNVESLVANTFLRTNTFVANTITANTITNAGSMSANGLSVGTGGLNVQGSFTLNGTTVYNTPYFTISAATPNIDAYFGVYRTITANASIKWDNANSYFAIGDVTSGANNYFYRILTAQQLTDSLSDNSSLNVATSKAANTLQVALVSANTSMKSYVDNINTAQNTNITTANNAAWAGYARANTSSNTFVGTSGSASPSIGIISFNSTNGITINGTSNVLTISTSQNLQTNGTPTFATVSLSSPSTAPTPATNTSNTQIATTAFVQNQLNNGNTYTLTSTVTNSVTVVNDSSTNATMYPVWVVANSGNNALRTSSANYYFNPSTGSLNATNFNSLSDENRKENIYQITNATGVIKQINGYGFNWKDNGKKSYGHIAQRLEEILPDLVDTNAEGVKSVNYNGLIAFLVETVKEMDKRITELESK